MSNSNWRNRPTSIERISTSTDWVISIDENGTPSLDRIIAQMISGEVPSMNDQIFVATACLMSLAEFQRVCTDILELKKSMWEDALFTYNGELKRVCLHSREIRRKEGPFEESICNHDVLASGISEIISASAIELFASVINKYEHVQRYSDPWHPYCLCMDFILERIVMRLGENDTCIVILEARGKREDKYLLGHIKNLIDNGNNILDSTMFKKIKGVYFNPKWSKEFACKRSFWSLEVADLCGHPIYDGFVRNTANRSYRVVREKFYRYPRYNGYGLKRFP